MSLFLTYTQLITRSRKLLTQGLTHVSPVYYSKSSGFGMTYCGSCKAATWDKSFFHNVPEGTLTAKLKPTMTDTTPPPLRSTPRKIVTLSLGNQINRNYLQCRRVKTTGTDTKGSPFMVSVTRFTKRSQFHILSCCSSFNQPSMKTERLPNYGGSHLENAQGIFVADINTDNSWWCKRTLLKFSSWLECCHSVVCNLAYTAWWVNAADVFFVVFIWDHLGWIRLVRVFICTFGLHIKCVTERLSARFRKCDIKSKAEEKQNFWPMLYNFKHRLHYRPGERCKNLWQVPAPQQNVLFTVCCSFLWIL